tara:strand:+ start:112 stop:294 length:183 start_codon:yes stop_codon:yes gene_type:complete
VFKPNASGFAARIFAISFLFLNAVSVIKNASFSFLSASFDAVAFTTTSFCAADLNLQMHL